MRQLIVSILYGQIAVHLNHNNNIRLITCKCIVLQPMWCNWYMALADLGGGLKGLHPPPFWSENFTKTRGPKGHISCTWVQYATFLRNRPRRTFLFTDRPEKHKLGRGRWDFSGRCFLSWFIEFRSAVSEEKLKMSHPIRGQGGHLVFPISAKNTNSVEDVEILLPVKFRWIPFSRFRREVENVSSNQRPEPSCFSDRPEKHKLGRGRWDLASRQVSLNSVQPFQRRSRKCLSQSEARAAILFFRSAWKTQTW